MKFRKVPCLVGLILGIMLVLGLQTSSRAQDTGASQAIETVSYQAVDSSTLRIFAIGTVDLETWEAEQSSRVIRVAIPHAGHGTGFLVGDKGMLLTAQHVVDGARHVVVRLPGKAGFVPARVILSNKEEDIAVLQIETALAAIELGDDRAALGVRQTVFAIGYPMDPARKQAQSAQGIVAGALDDGTLQLDISVNPGNSGGPLVDAQNRVVGMVVARGDVRQGVQGIGFAVPLARLTRALAEASQQLAGSEVPFTDDDKRSAAVVDELILRGALHVLTDRNDLGSTSSQQAVGEDLEMFAAEIEDSDLLTFISGNLWNAHLMLRYGDITTIAGNKVSKRKVRQLAKEIRRSALKLAYKAHRRDPEIARRSKFVRYAMRFFPERRQTRHAGTSDEMVVPDSASVLQSRREYGARAVGIVRYNMDNASFGTGYGAGLFVRQPLVAGQDGKSQTFLVIGAAASTIEISDKNANYRHRFVSAEVGLAHRMWRDSGHHVTAGLTWAPGYYQSEARVDAMVAASRSVFALAHVRASVGLEFGHMQVSTALRVLSGPTLWVEPVNLGFFF